MQPQKLHICVINWHWIIPNDNIGNRCPKCNGKWKCRCPDSLCLGLDKGV